MHAMQCIVTKEFRTNGIGVRFESPFHGNWFQFSCFDNFEPHQPCPARGLDKEEVESLRDWLNKVLKNYDATSNLCQRCFKALPKVAGLDNRCCWIVSCEHCGYMHELTIRSTDEEMND